MTPHSRAKTSTIRLLSETISSLTQTLKMVETQLGGPDGTKQAPPSPNPMEMRQQIAAAIKIGEQLS